MPLLLLNPTEPSLVEVDPTPIAFASAVESQYVPPLLGSPSSEATTEASAALDASVVNAVLIWK